MTRKSKREVERCLDDLDGGEEWSVQDVMWMSLKDYYDARLSPSEQRLKAALERDDDVLPPGEQRLVDGWFDGGVESP